MTRESMIEIRMSQDLALRIGAIQPQTLEEHRAWRESGGCFMVRDPRTMAVMFWPFVSAAPLLPRP